MKNCAPWKGKAHTMPSAWVQHVQATYKAGKAKGMSYKAAMQAAKKTWAAKKGKKADPKKAAKKEEPEEEEAEEAPKKRRRRKKKAQ